MTAKTYYEVHITMLGDKEKLKPLVESINWKFSAIDGDPVLGDGVKCYATTFYSMATVSEQTAIMHLHGAADKLRTGGANVVRKKVEQVIFDERVDHG